MIKRGWHYQARQFFFTGILFLILMLPAGVWAAPYSSILAFGDSLSDNGNADGFGIMRFSDGPVWVEYLADAAHLNAPLFDMAFGGATTGYDNPAAHSSMLGLNWQVDFYLANYYGMVSSDTLVTIWAGANDLFQGRSYATAEDNVELSINKLVNAGFKNFLIMNLPNIGETPSFNNTPYEGGATAWCNAFNALLAADLENLRDTYGGINFYSLDTYALLNGAIAHPELYGFTNVTSNGNGNPPAGYLFWDGVHPTTLAHSLIADKAMAAAAPVPEPATLVLLGTGLIGFAGFRKRFHR